MSKAPDPASQAPDGLDTEATELPAASQAASGVPAAPTARQPGSDSGPTSESEAGSEAGSAGARPPTPSLTRRLADRLEQNWQVLVAAAGVLVVAVVLLTRFSSHSELNRDQSIYVYGALRFSHGVPPYVSVFDPKTPGTTILGGIAVVVSHWFHWDSLQAIRWTFFVVTLATVLAVFALAHRLWSSLVAAVGAGVTMCCLTVFAESGLVGPEAKMPGLLFSTLAMYLMVRRRWFWAAVCAGLAFDFWQPFVWFGLIAIIAAVLDAGRGRRWRTGLVTFAGAALPTVLLGIYFAANGALSDFLVAAFKYPLTGTRRVRETFSEHFTHVAKVLAHYPVSNALVWTGTVLLVLLVVAAFVQARGHRWAVLRSPLVLIVFATFLLNLAYAFYDFQSNPDTLPLLIYPALGIGGAAAVVVRAWREPVLRQIATAAVSIVGILLISVQFGRYDNLAKRVPSMRAQLADACGLDTLLGKHKELVSLGNPALFVLTHRVSRSRFIYLAAGTDDWKIKHTPGGFRGWVHEIERPQPAVVAIDGWESPGEHNTNVHAMHLFLRADGYRRRYLGSWAVWIDKQTRDSARSLGVFLPWYPTPQAIRPDGGPLPPRVPCENQ